MVILNILILAAGFAALIKGADLFVDGSASLARIFRVPAMIVGLTIVAMGTSAPELAVSTVAAIEGSNEIAFSNVVGSNIFNILMVLGVCAVVRPVPVDGKVLKKDFTVVTVPTLAVFLLMGGIRIFTGELSGMDMESVAGTVTRPVAIALLVVFAGYLWLLTRSAKKNRREEENEFGFKKTKGKCALLILIGIVLIVAGGQAVVYAAKEIARALGMTETLIALTVVSVGTSLPELVTSLVAASKQETELAVGNVIGSNIFNMMMILGVSAAIHPVTVNVASVWDLLILLSITAVTWIFALAGKRINRAEGILMVLAYAGVIAFAIIR
ncbi:MAG: calcium/sodium antiporter [Clostridiales bacterium]|nr:calcium/sodium antiporter [Clostridiales bacterium]